MQFRKVTVLAVLLGATAWARADSPSVVDDLTVAFELQDRDGQTVTFDEYRGGNVLLAFGFTNCAHICPMIAANMASAIRQSDKDVIGIFVSVDTERDTPVVTDDYAKKYGDNMVGLSGDYHQVREAARNFNVTFVVTKSEDNYTVQHTPSIFLIGPEGTVVDVFAMNTAPSKMAEAMR